MLTLATALLLPGTATWDARVSSWLAGNRSDWLTAAMQAVTVLGSGWVAFPLLLGCAAWLGPRAARAGRWRDAVVLGAVAGGTALVVQILKALLARPRPDVADALTTAVGYAFPSGHATQAAVVYGLIAWLAVRRWPARRLPIWLGAAALAGLIGFSRLYLGVHWLSDVLAGYLLAGFVLVLAQASTRKRRVSPGQTPAPMS